MQTAEIVRFREKQEAKWICSACGADRGCDCNAPAIEKLAEIREKQRARQRKYDEKKRQQKQRSSYVRSDKMPTEVEADESHQETLFDQACLLLELMAGSTRQRFFAYLREKYDEVV